MRRPVCVPCSLEMKCRKNGVNVLFLDREGEDDVIYRADSYECTSCAQEIIVGFGAKPITYAFDDDFQYWKDQVDEVVKY